MSMCRSSWPCRWRGSFSCYSSGPPWRERWHDGRKVDSALQAGELAVGTRRILFGQRILSHQFLELRGEQRGAEVEALILVAAELGEQFQLLGCLHPLRDHF